MNAPIVTVIGVGNMGGSMAANLLSKGWEVRVCDIDAAKAAALLQLGAKAIASPALSLVELTVEALRGWCLADRLDYAAVSKSIVRFGQWLRSDAVLSKRLAAVKNCPNAKTRSQCPMSNPNAPESDLAPVCLDAPGNLLSC